MSFYSDIAADVRAILVELGASCTITSESDSAYAISTGDVTVTDSTATGYAAIFDYSDRDYGVQVKQGTLIKAGDKKLLLESAYVPVTGHSITFNGIKYNVMRVKTVAPAGTNVLTIVQLRL